MRPSVLGFSEKGSGKGSEKGSGPMSRTAALALRAPSRSKLGEEPALGSWLTRSGWEARSARVGIARTVMGG
jgi:hypothetical protein